MTDAELMQRYKMALEAITSIYPTGSSAYHIAKQALTVDEGDYGDD